MSSIRFLARAELDPLFLALAGEGYRCVGPTVRGGAINYEELERAEELPLGYGDRQAPGV